MTMTPGRRSNGQKSVVALPPPELSFVIASFYLLFAYLSIWESTTMIINDLKMVLTAN